MQQAQLQAAPEHQEPQHAQLQQAAGDQQQEAPPEHQGLAGEGKTGKRRTRRGGVKHRRHAKQSTPQQSQGEEKAKRKQ